MRKRCSIDFLRGGLPDVIDILDDDTSCQSKGVDQGTTAPHQRLEKGTRDGFNLGDGGLGKKPEDGSRINSYSCSVLPPGSPISGVVSTQMGGDGVYRPKRNLTHGLF